MKTRHYLQLGDLRGYSVIIAMRCATRDRTGDVNKNIRLARQTMCAAASLFWDGCQDCVISRVETHHMT